MSTIKNYYFHEIIIQRAKSIGGGKLSFTATGTVDVHMQRIDDRNSSVDAQVTGASHRIWCEVDLDIQDGDKVIDDSGTEYLVVAVRIDGVDWAINQHKEVYLRYWSD